MIESKKIFITGGAGFIGTSLVERLADLNQIIIYDNLHRNAIAKTELLDHPNVRFIEGDVLDIDKVLQATEGSNIIIHLAAIAGVDTVLESPVNTMRTNLIGTYNVLEASRHVRELERFVYFSTSEVFGARAYKVEEVHLTPNLTVGEARWTYAISKLAGEFMVHSHHTEYGLRTVIIRPFNVYGPRQVGEGAIHHFVVRSLKGRDLTVRGDGSQIRAWCYIDDLIDGFLLCLKKDVAIGNVFNIGDPRGSITIYNLAKEVIRLARSSSGIRFVPLGYTDVEIRSPDIEKARKILGYEPKVDLEEGLRRTIGWYRQKMCT